MRKDCCPSAECDRTLPRLSSPETKTRPGKKERVHVRGETCGEERLLLFARNDDGLLFSPAVDAEEDGFTVVQFLHLSGIG